MEDTFKNWLLPKIHDLGLTVSEFALECGLSPAAIYFYLSWKKIPSRGSVEKMCRYFGVSPLEVEIMCTRKSVGRPVGSKTLNRSKKHRSTVTREYRDNLFRMLNEQEGLCGR